MKLIFFSVFFGLISFLTLADAQVIDLRCGNDPNWHEFGDQKCFRLIQTLTKKDGAVALCSKYGGILPIIKSTPEQEFINNLLYEQNQVIDGVWIGASRYDEGRDFIWDNADVMSYFSNWNPNHPSNNTKRNCARMVSEAGRTSRGGNGKWEDISCEAHSLVLCEKVQIIPYHELLREVQKIRFEYEHTRVELEDTRNELKDTQNELKLTQDEVENLQQELENTNIAVNNSIPVGFLYFQIGSQPDPKTIWPQYTWKDISTEYPGLFFRVTGGGAGQLGSVQNESAPRLGNVYHSLEWRESGQCSNSISIPTSGKSAYIRTGGYKGTPDYCTSFSMSTGEVRPKNTAMKVWKRV